MKKCITIYDFLSFFFYNQHFTNNNQSMLLPFNTFATRSATKYLQRTCIYCYNIVAGDWIVCSLTFQKNNQELHKHNVVISEVQFIFIEQ